MLVFGNLLFGGKDALKNIEIIADVNWLRRSLSLRMNSVVGSSQSLVNYQSSRQNVTFPAKSKTETTVLLAIQSYISLKR